MYHLGGQVSIKYGEVDPLFIYKMVDNTIEFLFKNFNPPLFSLIQT